MMKISVKSVDFHADNKLIEYVQKKLSRLNRYFDRSLNAEVRLKLQDNGSRIKDKITEVRIQVPGNELLYKNTGRTFESAIDATVDTLKRQLVRHKEKNSIHGRGEWVFDGKEDDSAETPEA